MFNTGRVCCGDRYSGGSATIQLCEKSMTDSRPSDRRAKPQTPLISRISRIRRDNRVAGIRPSRSTNNCITERSIPRVVRAWGELPSSFRVLGAERQREQAAQRGCGTAELRQRVGGAQLLATDTIVSGSLVESHRQVTRDEEASTTHCDTRRRQGRVVVELFRAVAQLAQAALKARRDALPQHFRQVEHAPRFRLPGRAERESEALEYRTCLRFGRPEQQRILGDRGREHSAEVEA